MQRNQWNEGVPQKPRSKKHRPTKSKAVRRRERGQNGKNKKTLLLFLPPPPPPPLSLFKNKKEEEEEEAQEPLLMVGVGGPLCMFKNLLNTPFQGSRKLGESKKEKRKEREKWGQDFWFFFSF